jgi:hypothetical protein
VNTCSQWPQRHPDAGSSWPSWHKASYSPARAEDVSPFRSGWAFSYERKTPVCPFETCALTQAEGSLLLLRERSTDNTVPDNSWLRCSTQSRTIPGFGKSCSLFTRLFPKREHVTHFSSFRKGNKLFPSCSFFGNNARACAASRAPKHPDTHTPASKPVHYRGASLIRTPPSPWDHHRALGIGLL